MKEQAQEINHQMADHLRTLRQDASLTMRELADKLNTPHSFIGKIEKRGRRLDVGEFILYCQALDCEPNEVFKIVNEMAATIEKQA